MMFNYTQTIVYSSKKISRRPRCLHRNHCCV